jgi:hypothetical protein
VFIHDGIQGYRHFDTAKRKNGNLGYLGKTLWLAPIGLSSGVVGQSPSWIAVRLPFLV